MTQPITPPAGDPPVAPSITPPTDPAQTTPPAGDPPRDDKPLGPAGERALAAEREARKDLERKLAALAPLEQLAVALGGKPTGDGKTDLERLTERLAQHETELAAERSGRYRAEVAAEKGLTPAQAARLTGSTREELLADADALVALFPTAAPPGSTGPRPDPSQGARGGSAPDLDTQIAEAQKAGQWSKAIALKNQKLAAIAAKQQ